VDEVEKFANVGLDKPPTSVGEDQAFNGLTWHFYEATFEGNPVDLALAETDAQTLLVVLVSEPDERDQLYQAVFIPVVESLLPGDSQAAYAGDEAGTITSGTCRFVSEEQLAPNEGQQQVSLGIYLYAGPPDEPLVMQSLAYLTVIGLSELPEMISLHGKEYTLSSEGVVNYPIDTNQALPGDQNLPLVNLMLISIEPDIEEPITLKLGGQDYPLHLDYLTDEFTRNLFSSLGLAETEDEGYCQYHPVIQAELEAINSLK
jgi:hypothetical protein